jgi:hypothetical protein
LLEDSPFSTAKPLNARCSVGRWVCGLLVLIEAIGFGSAAARASSDLDATAGVAYDTVLKLVPAPIPPFRALDFSADFKAGMTPNGSCMPSVVRRYVTPERERIDEVCKDEATIVDCATRSVTSLDLQRRQYVRTSLDVASDDLTGAVAADLARGDSTSTIDVERDARGTRTSDGARTDEYAVVWRQAITSGGTSLGTRDSWTYEFLPVPLPGLACIDAAAPWLSRYGAPQRYAPELQGYFEARLRKVAKLVGTRYQLTENGPALPDWRIPLYAAGEHDQTQSDAPPFTYHFEIESGNVRAIRSDDPVFSVPADFTPS